MAAPAGSAIGASRGDGARAAQRLGVQPVPKHQAGKKARAFSNAGKGANPLIALLPDPSKADYAYWKSALKQQSARRAAKRAAAPKALAPEPLLVDEEEPEDFRGSNDTLATAQRIPAFGSAPTAGRRRGSWARSPRRSTPSRSSPRRRTTGRSR